MSVPKASFRLSDKFIEQYKDIRPPFGFNGLGEIVYLRSYSRVKEDGTKEKWYETVRRVVEGTYRIQERHIKSLDLGWSESRASKSAEEMYDRMFNMKFLPPGRGLQVMGSLLTEERGIYAALNSCAFISTENLDKDPIDPFVFLMDASMLGVGVGFDVKGAGKITVQQPDISNRKVFVIPDSREGWVHSLRLLLESYFLGLSQVEFDYGSIRGPGQLIKGFGGISSGPEPLMQMHKSIREVLDKNVGSPITIRTIVDIMNLEGVCIISGGIRRTATIILGPHDASEYRTLKDYKWDDSSHTYTGSMAERAGIGWVSNNSVFAEIGMNYADCASQTAINGEPGYFWIQNARDYSRMMGQPDYVDKKVSGQNPCAEQSLFDGEVCCLVENFPALHESLADFKRTLKFSYLYAKTVTLCKTHWPKTNRVLLKNRRIGTSLTGVTQFLSQHNIETLRQWCEEGFKTVQYYDKVYSDWLTVPRSIKTTSTKPSGSVSTLPGATSGMHYPESTYYIKNLRLDKKSELLPAIIEAGYEVEDDLADSSGVIVKFPVFVGEGVRSVADVSVWEQVALAAFLQRYWADNQVSCTATFEPITEADQIEPILNYYQYQLKAISFLPRYPTGALPQMPQQEITKEEYERLASKLKPLNFDTLREAPEPEKGCNSDYCELPKVSNA